MSTSDNGDWVPPPIYTSNNIKSDDPLFDNLIKTPSFRVWMGRRLAKETGYTVKAMTEVAGLVQALTADYFRETGAVTFPGLGRIDAKFQKESKPTSRVIPIARSNSCRLAFRPDYKMAREVIKWRPFRENKVATLRFHRNIRNRELMLANPVMMARWEAAQRRRRRPFQRALNKRATRRAEMKRAARLAERARVREMLHRWYKKQKERSKATAIARNAQRRRAYAAKLRAQWRAAYAKYRSDYRWKCKNHYRAKYKEKYIDGLRDFKRAYKAEQRAIAEQNRAKRKIERTEKAKAYRIKHNIPGDKDSRAGALQHYLGYVRGFRAAKKDIEHRTKTVIRQHVSMTEKARRILIQRYPNRKEAGVKCPDWLKSPSYLSHRHRYATLGIEATPAWWNLWTGQFHLSSEDKLPQQFRAKRSPPPEDPAQADPKQGKEPKGKRRS